VIGTASATVTASLTCTGTGNISGICVISDNLYLNSNLSGIGVICEGVYRNSFRISNRGGDCGDDGGCAG